MSMITKQQAVSLSLASVISSFLIAGTTTILLLSDGSLSFISHPTAAMKLVAAVSISCIAVKCVIGNKREHSIFREKPKMLLLTLVKSAGLLILMSMMFHIIAVLFGAPFYSYLMETYHFAMLMTIFICLPCCVVGGPRLDRWIEIFKDEREPGLETVVYLSASGAVIGAWLGAIPIPLDWDQPWQKWPITCSVGSIWGYSIGLFVASLYLPHKYKALFKPKSV